MIHGSSNLTNCFAHRESAYGPGPKAIGTSTDENTQNITRASTVSGLEAFSRYPTQGSFWAMAFPPTQFTGRARPWFLSY